jgi:hypothetical protein
MVTNEPLCELDKRNEVAHAGTRNKSNARQLSP